jgi:hypothetical protein
MIGWNIANHLILSKKLGGLGGNSSQFFRFWKICWNKKCPATWSGGQGEQERDRSWFQPRFFTRALNT